MEEEIRKEFMELLRLLDEGKLQEFKDKATECPPVDIAEGLEEIEDEGRVLRVFRMLPKDISSDVFSYMTSEQQQLIAESATNAELKALVDDMFMDDTVDFLEEMPANVVKKVLQNADEGTRKTINQFLNYPENSAGSLMTIEYVDLHDYFTGARRWITSAARASTRRRFTPAMSSTTSASSSVRFPCAS